MDTRHLFRTHIFSSIDVRRTDESEISFCNLCLELERVDAVPECLLRRHVHEEEGGDGRHGLAVAVDRVQNGVRLQHAVQLGLSDALVHAAKQLVRREVPVQVLLDGVDPLLVASLVLV